MALGAIGVAAGLATIALAFVVTNLVVGVDEGREVLTPAVGLVTVPLLPVFAALIGRTTQQSTQRRWRSLSVSQQTGDPDRVG